MIAQKSLKNAYAPQISSPQHSTKSGISQLSAAGMAMLKSEKRNDDQNSSEFINPISQPVLSSTSTALYPLKPQPPQRSSQDQKLNDSVTLAPSPYVASDHNTEPQLVQMGNLKGRSSSIDAGSLKNNRNQSKKSTVTSTGNQASELRGANENINVIQAQQNMSVDDLNMLAESGSQDL